MYIITKIDCIYNIYNLFIFILFRVIIFSVFMHLLGTNQGKCCDM